MMDKINQITFHFLRLFGANRVYLFAIQLKPQSGKQLMGNLSPPPEIKDGEMARFGASTLIWGERFCCSILFCPRLQVWKFLLRFLGDTFPHICR